MYTRPPNTPRLPIDDILPEITQQLSAHNRLIVQAPPGAGKSTGLPLALLADTHLAYTPKHQIWLLEPRRLAAQQVAQRMADQLGEPLGQTVGLVTGEQSRTSPQTRLVVMTEAILTQRMLAEQDIPQCGVILFDEFHERNLFSDLGLALAYECQQLLREDLKLVVMSATLAMDALKQQLDAPVLTSEGRAYPVSTCYLGSATSQHKTLEEHTTSAIFKALSEESGHVLVFLPGMAEIRRTQSLLESKDLPAGTQVFALHGQLAAAEQKRALAPVSDDFTRKVILATSVAETSLTIDGVRVVIDAGLERRARFNPSSGMDQMVTVPASQASAEQRRGRAGRQQAGVCYRLWSEDSHGQRPAHSAPDIEEQDLAGFALTLASWGSLTLSDYLLLDAPNAQRWQSAVTLLMQLDALDAGHNITATGQQMARLGVHPRLSHMLLTAQKQGLTPLACDLAAIISEGSALRFDHPNADIRDDLDLLQHLHAGEGLPKRFRHAQVNQHKAKRIQQLSKTLSRKLPSSSDTKKPATNSDSQQAGSVLLHAYPDRIAQQRGQGFRLSSGLGVQCLRDDPLNAQAWLVVADIQASQGKASIIRMAAPVSETELRSALGHHIQQCKQVSLNDKGQLKGLVQEKLGELVLSEKTYTPDADDINQGLLAHVRSTGLTCLPWDENSEQLRARLRWAHRLQPDDYPDVSDAQLLAELENWLLPFLTPTGLKQVPVAEALLALLPWNQQTQFNQDFPEALPLPSGRDARVDYQQDPPQVSCKLQECFGLTQSPVIGSVKSGSTQAVRLALLSPAQKPLALTLDLPHFWQNVYPDVRKEMRGRYPKHPWPENPHEHQATAKTKRNLH